LPLKTKGYLTMVELFRYFTFHSMIKWFFALKIQISLPCFRSLFVFSFFLKKRFGLQFDILLYIYKKKLFTRAWNLLLESKFPCCAYNERDRLQHPKMAFLCVFRFLVPGPIFLSGACDVIPCGLVLIQFFFLSSFLFHFQF